MVGLILVGMISMINIDDLFSFQFFFQESMTSNPNLPQSDASSKNLSMTSNPNLPLAEKTFL